MIMKRLAAFTAVFILGASLASAETRQSVQFSNPLLNEVVRMSNAGIGNETIIAYVKARQARLEGGLTADDLIGLREAGVGASVVQFLASATGLGVGPNEPGVASYEAGEGETVAVNPGVYGEPYAYGYPYGGWGWGWDGWWGYPGFYGSVVVGGGHGHGRGGHWGRGGGGHGGGGRGGGGHGGGGHGGGGHGGRR